MSEHKSSINIQKYVKVNRFFFIHNDRTKPPSYLLPQAYRRENIISGNGVESWLRFSEELTKRQEAYSSRTKQKMQATTALHHSIVVNMPQNADKALCEAVAIHLEQYGYFVGQYALHRDEGHIDELNKVHYNTHLHLECVGIDSGGKSVKFDREQLSKLQDEISAITGLERTHNTDSQRLTHKQYKHTMRMQDKAVKEAVAVAKQNINKVELKKPLLTATNTQQQHINKGDKTNVANHTKFFN